MSGASERKQAPEFVDIRGRSYGSHDLHLWLKMPSQTHGIHSPVTQAMPGEGSVVIKDGAALWKILLVVMAVCSIPAALLAAVVWLAWEKNGEFMFEHFTEPPLALVIPSELYEQLVKRDPVMGPDGHGGEMEITPEASDLWERWTSKAYSDITSREDPYRIYPFPTSEEQIESRFAALQEFNEFRSQNEALGNVTIRKAFILDFIGYWFVFTVIVSFLTVMIRSG